MTEPLRQSNKPAMPPCFIYNENQYYINGLQYHKKTKNLIVPASKCTKPAIYFEGPNQKEAKNSRKKSRTANQNITPETNTAHTSNKNTTVL